MTYVAHICDQLEDESSDELDTERTAFDATLGQTETEPS